MSNSLLLYSNKHNIKRGTIKLELHRLILHVGFIYDQLPNYSGLFP